MCLLLLLPTNVDCTGRGLWCTKRLLNWKMKSLFQLLCLDDIFSIVMNQGSKTTWVLKVGSYGQFEQDFFFHCLPKFWHIWRFIKLERQNYSLKTLYWLIPVVQKSDFCTLSISNDILYSLHIVHKYELFFSKPSGTLLLYIMQLSMSYFSTSFVRIFQSRICTM